MVCYPETGHGRAVLQGIARYAHVHGAWDLINDTWRVGTPGIIGALPGIDGSIISGTVTASQARGLRRLAGPVVLTLCGPEDRGLPCVVDDKDLIARTAVEHLASLHMRRVGFVDHHGGGSARSDAFGRAAREAGLECFHFPPDGGPIPTGPDGLRQTVEWAASLPKPIGVFAFHTQRAREFAVACSIAAVQVPEEIAVLGFGGDELLCGIAEPPLSSIDPDGERIGFEAARMLDDLMHGRPLAERRIVVPPAGVIRRRSSDVFTTDDPLVRNALHDIHREACDGLTVQDLVEASGLSRRAFEYRFRRVVGRTPHDELRRIRLATAQQLLRTTRLPLIDVAMRCGFAHGGALIVAFGKPSARPPAPSGSEVLLSRPAGGGGYQTAASVSCRCSVKPPSERSEKAENARERWDRSVSSLRSEHGFRQSESGAQRSHYGRHVDASGSLPAL